MFGLFFDYICFVTLLSHLLALRPSSSPSPPLLLLCMMGAATENSFPSVLCMQVFASIVCFRLCCQYFSGTLHPLLRKFRQHRRGWLMGSCPSSVTLSSFSAFFPLFYKITDQVSAIKQTFVSCFFMSNIITSPNYKVHIFTQ